ncbi:hypothetical protein L596_028631 [Steinernema carpocapsae]|uniref:Uncharacterized protein n=1 Tax=Steinernema carpocapsae TaxID=34508 RepID=A0A4U5LYZ0_STECR|nr:hypothetical protein L596_028631 [Steinernema carpocapsae]
MWLEILRAFAIAAISVSWWLTGGANQGKLEFDADASLMERMQAGKNNGQSGRERANKADSPAEMTQQDNTVSCSEATPSSKRQELSAPKKSKDPGKSTREEVQTKADELNDSTKRKSVKEMKRFKVETANEKNHSGMEEPSKRKAAARKMKTAVSTVVKGTKGILHTTKEGTKELFHHESKKKLKSGEEKEKNKKQASPCKVSNSPLSEVSAMEDPQPVRLAPSASLPAIGCTTDKNMDYFSVPASPAVLTASTPTSPSPAKEEAYLPSPHKEAPPPEAHPPTPKKEAAPEIHIPFPRKEVSQEKDNLKTVEEPSVIATKKPKAAVKPSADNDQTVFEVVKDANPAVAKMEPSKRVKKKSRTSKPDEATQDTVKTLDEQTSVMPKKSKTQEQPSVDMDATVFEVVKDANPVIAKLERSKKKAADEASKMESKKSLSPKAADQAPPTPTAAVPSPKTKAPEKSQADDNDATEFERVKHARPAISKMVKKKSAEALKAKDVKDGEETTCVEQTSGASKSASTKLRKSTASPKTVEEKTEVTQRTTIQKKKKISRKVKKKKSAADEEETVFEKVSCEKKPAKTSMKKYKKLMEAHKDDDEPTQFEKIAVRRQPAKATMRVRKMEGGEDAKKAAEHPAGGQAELDGELLDAEGTDEDDEGAVDEAYVLTELEEVKTTDKSKEGKKADDLGEFSFW